jgi:hypothetical protein
MTTTTQMKNQMMPGMAYPATLLALATGPSYPVPPHLFGNYPLLDSRYGGPLRCAGQRFPAAAVTAAVIACESGRTTVPATRTVGVA